MFAVTVALSGASVLANSGHETGSAEKLLAASALLVTGALMLVFRRQHFEFWGEVVGRGKLGRYYDLETNAGRWTLWVSFTVIPALFVVVGTLGLVSALVG